MSSSPQILSDAIRNVPDFPKPGIQFKDITPILSNPVLFQNAIDALIKPHQPGEIEQVAGIDARGFIFASAAALRLNAGFVPIRKKGKLPYNTHEESYDLEYGSNTVEVHTDAFSPGAKVLLVDDLLATGGTALAALKLLKRLKAQVVEAVFLVELTFLNAREKISHIPTRTIISY
ncbi:MAG: Adenine phosphoribosyltransferase [Verrucomicrobia subdivision 3 bacterium]|nr:Adenine phosphoribosyltransferase [Limisphaerales bacterium]MCS1416651.1 Adenine phosphoribosyltransferase [Limisphaerales bacterium]